MRAMIVDDEAPARSELKFLLEETGRLEEIIEATSARDAVESLALRSCSWISLCLRQMECSLQRLFTS